MANEKRLIAFDPITYESFTRHATKHREPYDHYDMGYVDAVDRIEDWMDANTVDAVEVVHGRWEDVKETALNVPDMKYAVTHTAETCSICKVRIGFIGSKQYLYDKRCPNCGAKMDGDGNGL